MTLIFWIIGIILTIYLALVIPAGISVLIKEIKYKKSHDKPIIDAIIRQYTEKFKTLNKTDLEYFLKESNREIIKKNGEKFSIDIGSKKSKNGNNIKVWVSVGKLNFITIGHTEKLNIKFKKNRP